MACTALTKGRGLDCNRISGGIKYVYFGVYDQFDAPIETTGIVQSGGEITDIEMGANVLYRYTMPLGTASLSESITGSRENGTIFYTPTLNVILNRLTKEDQNQNLCSFTITTSQRSSPSSTIGTAAEESKSSESNCKTTFREISFTPFLSLKHQQDRL